MKHNNHQISLIESMIIIEKIKMEMKRELHVQQSIDVTTVPYQPYDIENQVERNN